MSVCVAGTAKTKITKVGQLTSIAHTHTPSLNHKNMVKNRTAPVKKKKNNPKLKRNFHTYYRNGEKTISSQHCIYEQHFLEEGA